MTEAIAVHAAPPPHAAPANKPLRFPQNVTRLITNNLSIIPERAYHEDVVIAPAPPRMAFITGAAAVEQVLKTRAGDFPKGRIQNEVLEPLFGDAIFSAVGEDWRWQRGLAAPLFRHEQIMGYAPVFRDAADATIHAWRADRSGVPRAINKDMMHATFAVIARGMLGSGAAEVIAAIERGHADYFRWVNWRVLYRAFGLPQWLPRPGGHAMRAQEKRLRDSVAALVAARRADGAVASRDLLGLLLAADDPAGGRRMPPEKVINNIIAFLVGGYDTTALALSWTLYLLARHPDWQDRVRAEIAEVAGDGPIGPEHLAGLVLTERVLNESLRLYPTAPMIVRDILADIEIAGTSIRKHTIGIVPIYAIHRHRSFWRDPDNFDPDRFDPAQAPKPGRYQFLPFGAGPRICLGAAFAMIEAKVMLAAFVRGARFEPGPGPAPKPTGQMFLTANGDMPIRVTAL